MASLVPGRLPSHNTLQVAKDNVTIILIYWIDHELKTLTMNLWKGVATSQSTIPTGVKK